MARLILTIFSLVVFSFGDCYAKSDIKKIGFTNSNKIYVEVDKKTNFKAFSLKKPDRIVLDINDSSNKNMEKPGYIKNVKSVRASNDSRRTRLVFDLLSPAKVMSSSYTKSPGDKFGKITITTSKSRVERRSKTSGKAKVSKDTEYKPIIMIDAGHGGKDPGAIGRYLRTKEKVITLSYAKSLYKALKKSGKYRVYLTRNNDKFIELRQRVKKARKVKADLFISIHANSSKNRKAKGFSIYTLSETASDKETAKLASKENRSGGIADINFKNINKDIIGTLIDLSQRNSMNFSSKFANLAIKNVEKKKVKTLRNTHRYAGFVVLTAPDMVSILIELGYLTNRSEEKLLNNINYKRRLTSGLKAAIDEYFKFRN